LHNDFLCIRRNNFAILANVYLHNVLDRWFQEVVKPYCSGKAILIRLLMILSVRSKNWKMPNVFMQCWEKRLGKFGLELSAEKTRIIPFSSTIKPARPVLNFLGFEFRWEKTEKGSHM